MAAVTAAVVTTALVGTTLPDLLADRAASSVHQQNQNAEGSPDSVVVTELPEVPSAKEISSAKESSQATDQMIGEINERLSQASQRALELEAAMQIEHQNALEAEQQAAEAAEAAEAAREAADTADSGAADQYQAGETTAEDVLLAEDDNTLADAATEQQLEEQAESDAADAEQQAAEAEALADQASQQSTAAAEARETAERNSEQNSSEVTEVGERALELIDELADLKGMDASILRAQITANSDFHDADGNVDPQKIAYHIDLLRGLMSEDSAESDDDETPEGSSDDGEGEASSSDEPEGPDAADATVPAHSLDQYLASTRDMVARLAELEETDVEAMFQKLVEDEDFLDEDGLLDHAALQSRVYELSPGDAPEPEDDQEQDEAPAEDEATQDEDEADESDESDESDEATQDEEQTDAGSVHSLADYLPGTQNLVERLAELEDTDTESMFQQLIDDEDFLDENGILDHPAVHARVYELEPQPEPEESDEDEEQSSSATEDSEEPAQQAHRLDHYLPGTQGLVKELAELEDESPAAMFEKLIADSDFTDSDGLLDHAALRARVNELTPEPEPEPEQSNSSSSSSSNTSSASSSAQPSGPTLDQYLPGTRTLVEQLADLEDESPAAMFEKLIGDSDFTDSSGLLDHDALRARVNELTPEPEPEPEPEQSSSSSESNSSSSSSAEPTGPRLEQYLPGTRALVEQLADLRGDGVQETFRSILGDSSLVGSNGVIDHAALQREVNRLTPEPEPEPAPSTGSSSSGSSSSGTSSSGSSSSSSGSQSAAAGSASAAQIAVNFAVGKVNEPGTHYVLGATGPKAWDCSSLMQASFAQAGISLPRTAHQQFQGGQSVSLDNLQPGDIVFWVNGGRATHNAIYIGNGQVAHARNPQAGLSITSVYYAYQDPHPVAKRYW
ncbi:C40 family peptidase [Nesterenkonia suensis]